MRTILLLFFLLLTFFNYSKAQDTTNSTVFSLGGQLHYGTIFVHSNIVSNTAGSFPYGLHLEANWQNIGQKAWDFCRCYPQQGLLLAYFNYDSRILGQSLSAAYFLEPTFRMGKKIDISFRTALGLSYLTNPYDQEKNPENFSYSLPVSAYLVMALATQVKLDKHWKLNLQAGYHHVSNGGVKTPNAGINWPVGSLGVNYIFKPQTLPFRTRHSIAKPRTYPLRWHTHTFLSNKGIEGENGRYFLGGLEVGLSKQVGKLSALTLGSEVYKDDALERLLYINGYSSRNSFKIGLLAGHEFLLGKFTFSQQLGIYLYDDSPFYPAWYHRWGIVYYFVDHWGIGTNVKSHRHIANFFDIRIARRF